MSRPQHDHSSLGAYALGVLTPQEATEIEAHLSTCPDGRREVSDLVGLRRVLDTVPPEAFIDGPPPGGDLLLQRTLRRVRAEEQAPARPSGARRLAAVAAAVVIAGGALVAGIVIGQDSNGPAAPNNVAVGTPFTAKDAGTGASADLHVEPLSGWVKVHAKVDGVRQGEQCQLVVVGKDGSQRIAGSWPVTAKAEHDGTTIDGAALVAPANVKSVDVVTLDNRKLVSVPVKF